MTQILIVDDSKSMRQMVRLTLSNAGYEVVECVDGEEACQWAKNNHPPALVISDLNMPNMDGLTLVKNLRQLEKYKSLPIIMLTTESSAEQKSIGKSVGATGWIVKPFNPEQLIKTVNMVINKDK